MESIEEIIRRLPPEAIKTALERPSGSPGIKCQICQDDGRVYPRRPDGKVNYSMTIPCVCKKEENIRRNNEIYLKMCELPVASEHMTFGNFRVYPSVKESYEAAVRTLPGGDLSWLTLLGGVDLGKTHLAVAICREWLSQGKAAKYAYVPILLDELRAGMGKNIESIESYEYRFRIFLTVPLLVLDDLGTENSTPWVQERLDTIVDYRYMHNLALVVTSNLKINQLPVRIASRLQRYSKGKVVGIDANEYRLNTLKVEQKLNNNVHILPIEEA